MADYAWSTIFEDIGKLIAISNYIEAWEDEYDELTVDANEFFNDDVDDINFVQKMLATLTSGRSGVSSTVTSTKSKVQALMLDLIQARLASTMSSWDTLIEDMKIKMLTDNETVKANSNGVAFRITETGDNNDQLAGYEGLAGVSSDVLDASGKLYFQIRDVGGGLWRVEIFNDAGCTGADQVGHTYSYNVPGVKTVLPDNDSGLCGTVRIVQVFCGDANIACEFVVWGGNNSTKVVSRTGDGTINLDTSQMAAVDDFRIQCTSAATEGSELWRIYSRKRGQITGASGLVTTGVAFDPSAVGTIEDRAGLSVEITAGATGFAVGDSFEFSTLSLNDGVFQTYFRDKLDQILPYKSNGMETITDALAEYVTPSS